MTNFEIGLTVFAGVQTAAIYWLTKYNRDLMVEKRNISDRKNLLEKSFDETLTDWQLAKNENQKHLNKIMELEKKVKLSSDVVAVLNDIQQGGALLHVERVDRNDVFFHQGGQYR